MNSFFKKALLVFLIGGLLASIIINFNQQNKIKKLNTQVRYQESKLTNFASITGKIFTKYTKIDIDQLAKDHFIMKPFDEKGDGYIIDYGVKHGGIKYFINSENIIVNWEPYPLNNSIDTGK